MAKGRRRSSGLVLGALLISAGCGRAFDDSDGAGGAQHPEGGSSGAGSLGTMGGTAAGRGGNGGTPGLGCTTATGFWIESGTSFRAGDRCNTCTCEGTTLTCTERDCSVCEELQAQREAAIEEAKRCDPALGVEQCTKMLGDRLQCGCLTFANPANGEAISTMDRATQAYVDNGCVLPTSCLQCEEVRASHCSSEGRCEDERPVDRGCEVGGVRYPIGATGIPDPVSCNTCTCADGGLECTDTSCPRPCPSGTAFGTSCAQCGPSDACEVVAFGCYEICVEGCDDIGMSCIDGLCRPSFCG